MRRSSAARRPSDDGSFSVTGFEKDQLLFLSVTAASPGKNKEKRNPQPANYLLRAEGKSTAARPTPLAAPTPAALRDEASARNPGDL